MLGSECVYGYVSTPCPLIFEAMSLLAFALGRQHKKCPSGARATVADPLEPKTTRPAWRFLLRGPTRVCAHHRTATRWPFSSYSHPQKGHAGRLPHQPNQVGTHYSRRGDERQLLSFSSLILFADPIQHPEVYLYPSSQPAFAAMHHPAVLTALAAALATLPGCQAMYTKNSPVLQLNARTYKTLIEQSNYTSVCITHIDPSYRPAQVAMNDVEAACAYTSIDCRILRPLVRPLQDSQTGI